MKDFSSLIELFDAIPDEKAAIRYFKAIRWANGEYCPYCGHPKVYETKGGIRWKCAQCANTFSIRVGTIFEDTKLPLRKWLAAIWLITNHSKGIASTTLARDLDISQKSAWFMLHRLRHAARTRSFNRKLRGTIESDEGYFGGRDTNRHLSKRGKIKKALAMGLVERGGEARVIPIRSTNELRAGVVAHVQEGSRLMTDEATAFSGLGAIYDHKTFSHKRKHYGDGADGHTNTVEGLWALIKRQIYGIHHFVSEKHLHRYLSEATWRYNRRNLNAPARVSEFLTRVDGRLKYNVLIGKV